MFGTMPAGNASCMLELTERETKWDVDHRFVLPDLSGVIPGARVAHDTVDLVSAYYDTADADLQVHGLLLRRRDGDDDTGWRLTIPGAESRTELHWPLSDTPPAELMNLLIGVTGGKQLHNIGTIRTARRRHRINEPGSDDLVAEVADDEVRASAGDRLLAWRELEVEPGPRVDRQLEQIGRMLKKAGATPAHFPSKLAHLLRPEAAPDRSPAAAALAEYLDTQIAAVVAGDIGLRRGRDPIHDTRVALRRLRSTLRIFAPVLRPATVGDLEDELKWFAGLLGEVRDCQVQQRRFAAALDELPDVLVLGPVRSRVGADLQAVELPARAEVRAEMDKPRYLQLMATLRDLRTDPPVDDGSSVKALRKRAGKAAHKADRRLSEALQVEDEALLHRARKAAKRARYAAELVGALAGERHPKRIVKQYKKMQTVLGDHQDTVVARDVLRRMATGAAVTGGENGFTFGLLYAREQRIAEDCHRAVHKLR